MNNKDYQEAEHWETRHEANRTDARRAFFEDITALQITFEHMINNDYGVVIIENTQFVGGQLTKMDNLAFLYFYKCEEGEFEYDFRNELKSIKVDELGFSADLCSIKAVL